MPWRCESCGGENPEGMRFCGHCGSPAAAATPPATASAPPVAPPAEPEADALRSFVTGQVADRLIESGGEISEERRLVTALFADLSGFTPLSERLDPEELLEVIDPIIRALSDIVGRYEGFVEKFAGDALLALFGAPVAHEDDAVRAVLVAGEMHRELARLRSQLGPDAADLTLHIGVNSGHGVARLIGSNVRMDYAVLGDSVILAQRLESAAPPGETYIGETTARLVGERFELEPVGPLTLKGKAEPVPAWRLLGEKAIAEQRATGERHTAPLVGRAEEVGAVTAVLEALAAGSGGVMTLVGEPGVGKSRLTDEARLAAGALGIRWLEARCLSYGAGLAYWPYLDLLRRVAGIRVEDPPERGRDALAESLAALGRPQLLPFLARALGLPAQADDPTAGLEPEAFRRGLHDAMAEWLRATAAEQPLVLAIEDGHWADASTIGLTLELARTFGADPIMLYLTSRPTDGGLVDQVAGPDARIALSIRLEPLDEAGVAELAEHLLGGQPPHRLSPVLVDRGAGNPFFVQETVRSLVEQGVLTRTDDRWELRPGWDASDVPPTIEGVLAARIDALSAPAGRLLGVASVIGRRVRLALLRAVSGASGIEGPLGQLEAAGFLDSAGEADDEAMVFHHALMQEVAYGRLIRRRRRALHLRTAEAAEELYGSGDDVVDLLARHLYLGGAGARAIDYLLRAGDRARALFANEEAIVDYTRAVELVRADPDQAGRLPELLLALADLHELVGNYDDARRLYEEARDLTGDVRAWRGIAATLRSTGRFEEALKELDAAFASHPPEADLRALWLERGWSLTGGGSLPEAVVAYGAGIDAAVGPTDVMTARLLVELARAEATEGRFDAAAAQAARAVSILEDAGDPPVLVSALRVLGGVQDDLQDYAAAEHTLQRALSLAERVGKSEEVGHSLVNLAFVQRNRGDLLAAVQSLERAMAEYERIGHASGRAIAYANLGEVQVRAGNLEEAERLSLRAGELARSIGHSILHAQSLENLAEIRMKQERFDDVLDYAQRAAMLFGEAGVTHIAAECWELAAQAADHLGDAEHARELAARASSLIASET